MHLLDVIPWLKRHSPCLTFRLHIGTEDRGTRSVYGLPAVIGRSAESDVCIPDCFASRTHCLLNRRGEEVFVRDLESRHGTWVNGDRVVEQTLGVGDVIWIGGSRMTVLSVDVDSEPCN